MMLDDAGCSSSPNMEMYGNIGSETSPVGQATNWVMSSPDEVQIHRPPFIK